MNEGLLGMGVVFSLKDDFTSNAQKIRNEFSNLSGVTDQLSQRVNKSLNNMQLGASALGLGLSLVAPLGIATSKAMDFEQQMSNVKSVMSPDQINKFGKEVEKLSMEMGAKTSFSAIEAGKGLEELIKAGVSLEKILSGGLEGALELAVAGELDLASASEIASTALNAFKKDNLEVRDAANILAGAANASATSVQELRFGLQMSSAVASGAGVSFLDNATALAVFAQNGLKGSDAGTSFKTMLMNLTPDTKKATDVMKKFGIITAEGSNQFYDATGNLKSLADISGILRTALEKLNPQQRGEALKTMFGQDAIRAGNILFAEGAEGVRKMQSEMMKITAAQVATEKLNNLKGVLTIINSTFETLAITTGNIFIPILTRLAKGFQVLLSIFTTFVGTQIGRYFIILVSVLGTLLTVLGTVVIAMNLAKFTALKTAIAFQMMGKGAIASAFATKGLAGGLRVLAIEGYKTLLAFAPYIAVFAIVGAVVYSAYQSYRAFQEVLAGTAKPASGLLGLMQKFGGVIAGVIQVFSTWDGKTFNLGGMEESLKSLGILDFVLNLSTWIVRLIEFVKGVGSAFYEAFSFVASIVGSVYNFVVKSINSFANALGFQGEWLSKTTTSIESWAKAGKILGYVIMSVLVVAFWSLASSIIATLSPIYLIVGAVAGLIYIIYNWKAIVGVVTRFVVSAFHYVSTQLVTDISRALFWIAENVPTWIGQAFQYALDFVLVVFSQFIPTLIYYFVQFSIWLLQNVPMFFYQAFYYAFQFVVTVITEFIPYLIGLFANFLYWIVTNVPYLIFSAFSSAFLFVFNLLKDVFPRMGKFFWDFGVNIVTAIKEGILSVWDSFTEWIGGLISSIPGVEYLFGDGKDSGNSKPSAVASSLNKQGDLSNVIADSKAFSLQFSQPVVLDKTTTKTEQPIFNITLDGEEIRNTIEKGRELDKSRK